MTTFEAGMWISGAAFTVSLIFAGLGAHFEERRLFEAQKASFMLAAALFGISCISAGKSLLSLVIN